MSIEMNSVKAYPDGRMLVNDAAAYLGLSRHTLAAMRSKGKGPRFFKRGKVFYFIADLDAWVREGATTVTKKSVAAGDAHDDH